MKPIVMTSKSTAEAKFDFEVDVKPQSLQDELKAVFDGISTTQVPASLSYDHVSHTFSSGSCLRSFPRFPSYCERCLWYLTTCADDSTRLNVCNKEVGRMFKVPI